MNGQNLDFDTLMFFNEHQKARELYQIFEELLYSTFSYCEKARAENADHLFQQACVLLRFVCESQAKS